MLLGLGEDNLQSQRSVDGTKGKQKGRRRQEGRWEPGYSMKAKRLHGGRDGGKQLASPPGSLGETAKSVASLLILARLRFPESEGNS